MGATELLSVKQNGPWTWRCVWGGLQAGKPPRCSVGSTTGEVACHPRGSCPREGDVRALEVGVLFFIVVLGSFETYFS